MSPFFRRAAGLAAAFLLAASSAAPALAASGDTSVVVVNDSNVDMVQLYVGRDQVLGGPVAPGQAVRIDPGPGRGCMARITAVFADGTSQASMVDACQVGQTNATARGIPICPGDARCKRTG